jgi:predicted NAD/FAD-dependent oxidoreductase
MDKRIAIIGAGIAGLACARRLAAGGVDAVVFDKGRGIGGRLATRRAGALQFDHGAQYVTARAAGFAAVLDALERSGAAARWLDGGSTPRFVGLPGMSGLARALAEGIEVQGAAQVSGIAPDGAGRWRVGLPDGASAVFDRVVITAPAPQAVALLPAGHPMAERIAVARFDPCLTLMAAFAPDAPRPFQADSDEHAPLAWIAQDSSKPGRPEGATGWVAHASTGWSLEHLERAPQEIASLMLPLLAARLGVDPGQALHTVAHRWRFARVARALGQPFLRDDAAQVYAGGDWCLGPRVEAAWQCGDAIGADILAQG